MKLKREMVTPFLVFIFLVTGISGICMFFHLFDDYTNVVHEFLGLTFFTFAILHIILNWKSIANYSNKRLLAVPAVIIILISTGFIIAGKIKGNLENELLQKLVDAPVADSFKVLDVDYKEAEAILNKNNISITDSSESIHDISRKNQKDPEEIIELIYNKNDY